MSPFLYYMDLHLYCHLTIQYSVCSCLLFLLLLLLVPRFTNRLPLPWLSLVDVWRASRTRSAETLLMPLVIVFGCLRLICRSGVELASWHHAGLAHFASWRGLAGLPTAWSFLVHGVCTQFSMCPS